MPKINRDLNGARMHFGPNLEILISIGGDLSRGQAQNGGKILTWKSNVANSFVLISTVDEFSRQ